MGDDVNRTDRSADEEEKLLNARLKVITTLNASFMMERYVYLTLSSLSFVIVCVVGWKLFTSPAYSNALLAMFLGPTGFIGFMISRVLVMWTRSMAQIIK